MNIAIIPARGGSTRIPRKNIKDFHGKPIIAYSIETAIESELFDKIYVSTEDAEIANIATYYGATGIHQRPDEMAQNEVGTYDVVSGFLKTQKIDTDDLVCCIYATAPLMRKEDLMTGYTAIKYNYLSDHAISISYPPLEDAAQFYWSVVGSMREKIEYWGIGTIPILIAPERVCDINTMEDWARAEQKYKDLK